MAEQIWDVYMSGAIAGLTDDQFQYATSEIYDRVLRICEGMKLNCYCPHRSQTRPSENMLPQKVWKIDRAQVNRSKAVIAYLGLPSFGVGMEIEMARTANIPVVLLSERDKVERLSKMVLGSPCIVDIVLFDAPREFEDTLRKPLVYLFSKSNLEEAAYEENWPLAEYRRLAQMLEDQIAADRFRSAPREPISKENWRARVSRIGQDVLFEV